MKRSPHDTHVRGWTTRGLRALVLGAAFATVVTGAGACQPATSATSWSGPRRPVPPRGSPRVLPRCTTAAYVVGDSRRTLEHKVLPRTTDRIWAEQLGSPGGALVRGMGHVRYLAEPGVVHEFFRADLAALMASCGRSERPLIFDFMGTNYPVKFPDRFTEPAFYEELSQEIAGFYASAAPNARVVLAELTLDRDVADPDLHASVELYLTRYNDVLRGLARTSPARFFFLPAPRAYDTTVVWRDTTHETAGPLLDELQGATPAGELDAAGLALISQGGACALTEDPRFGAERNSEMVTLIAYLQDFRSSAAAMLWAGIGPATVPGGWTPATTPSCTF